ncbi:MAG TPA: hypothetical protein VHW74_18175 [Mycobacteriales bacterium]|jgi:hypothetical protein|nr:hypothetical protein [Mycobacteriales bacterium]
MTGSRKRHIGSAAVLALTASSGLALVTAAGPAAAVTPQPAPVASTGYSLSVAVATKSIQPGGTDIVSGVLSKAGVVQAGDTVILRARPDGKWFGHRVASAVTSNDGAVQFTVQPSKSSHYRLVFRIPVATPAPVSTAASADATTVAARSAAATVHVVQPSSLSIRTKQRHGAGREVVMGQLRGDGHALAHRQVMLQGQSVGSAVWTTLKTRRTHRNGVVEFLAPNGATAEQFQLVFAGGANYTGSTSGVFTVNVA